MKAEAVGLALRSADPIERGNILREYVQASALRSLHEARAFERLSFVGGTAFEAALLQTATRIEGNWRENIEKRLGELDFKALRADIEAFLERRADAAYVTREGLASVLASEAVT